MKILALLINVLVGLFFIASAYLKLVPVEFFEAKISSFGISGVLIPITARLILGFEFLLGLCLLFQFTLNKKIQKLTILALTVFLAVNLIDYIRHGNDTNCGCMGMKFAMSPLASALKNVLLIGLMIISHRFSSFQIGFRNNFINAFLLLIPFTVMFIWEPVYVPADYEMPMKGKKLDFAVMEGHPGMKGKTFTEDLSKGRKIVAFLSVTCIHCKIAAFKLSQYKSSNPELPVYFILNGDSADFKGFMDVARPGKVEMAHFNGKDDFANMSGYHLPSIYLINNGVVEVQLNTGTLDAAAINSWYNKK